MPSSLIHYIFLLALILLSSDVALSQSPWGNSALKPLENQLLGKSMAEIGEILGKPERTKALGDSEIWHYGKSIVVFRDGRVSVWSDSGNLEELLKIHRPSNPNRTDKELRRGWKNPWTRKKTVSDKEVLDNILKKEDSGKDN